MKQFNIVIDFSNMLYRSLYMTQIPKSTGKQFSKDEDINSFICKLTQDITFVIRNLQKNSRVIFAIDGRYPWRKDLLKNEPLGGYKAQRKKDIEFDWDKIHSAANDLLTIFSRKGYAIVEIESAEGDDIMALIKNLYFDNSPNDNLIIVSSDKDITQLVDYRESTGQFCVVLNPIGTKGGSSWADPLKTFSVTEDFDNLINQKGNGRIKQAHKNPAVEYFRNLESKMPTRMRTIDPEDVVLHKIFCGDDGDNIPAIYGYYNDKNKYTRVTQKRYEAIIKSMGISNSRDLLENVKVVNAHVADAMKLKTLNEDLEMKVYRQQRLVELDPSLFPNEIVDEFNTRFKEGLLTYWEIGERHPTFHNILEGTKYLDNIQKVTQKRNEIFKDLDHRYPNSLF